MKRIVTSFLLLTSIFLFCIAPANASTNERKIIMYLNVIDSNGTQTQVKKSNYGDYLDLEKCEPSISSWEDGNAIYLFYEQPVLNIQLRPQYRFIAESEVENGFDSGTHTIPSYYYYEGTDFANRVENSDIAHQKSARIAIATPEGSGDVQLVYRLNLFIEKDPDFTQDPNNFYMKIEQNGNGKGVCLREGQTVSYLENLRMHDSVGSLTAKADKGSIIESIEVDYDNSANDVIYKSNGENEKTEYDFEVCNIKDFGKLLITFNRIKDYTETRKVNILLKEEAEHGTVTTNFGDPINNYVEVPVGEELEITVKAANGYVIANGHYGRRKNEILKVNCDYGQGLLKEANLSEFTYHFGEIKPEPTPEEQASFNGQLDADLYVDFSFKKVPVCNMWALYNQQDGTVTMEGTSCPAGKNTYVGNKGSTPDFNVKATEGNIISAVYTRLFFNVYCYPNWNEKEYIKMSNALIGKTEGTVTLAHEIYIDNFGIVADFRPKDSLIFREAEITDSQGLKVKWTQSQKLSLRYSGELDTANSELLDKTKNNYNGITTEFPADENTGISPVETTLSTVVDGVNRKINLKGNLIDGFFLENLMDEGAETGPKTLTLSFTPVSGELKSDMKYGLVTWDTKECKCVYHCGDIENGKVKVCINNTDKFLQEQNISLAIFEGKAELQELLPIRIEVSYGTPELNGLLENVEPVGFNIAKNTSEITISAPVGYSIGNGDCAPAAIYGKRNILPNGQLENSEIDFNSNDGFVESWDESELTLPVEALDSEHTVKTAKHVTFQLPNDLKDAQGVIVRVPCYKLKKTDIWVMSCSGGGTVSIPIGKKFEYYYGDTPTLTITPHEGFRIKELLVDGQKVEEASEQGTHTVPYVYTFKPLTKPTAVDHVYFEKIPEVISVVPEMTAGGNVYIRDSQGNEVHNKTLKTVKGENITIEVASIEGYEIETIKVNETEIVEATAKTEYEHVIENLNDTLYVQIKFRRDSAHVLSEAKKAKMASIEAVTFDDSSDYAELNEANKSKADSKLVELKKLAKDSVDAAETVEDVENIDVENIVKHPANKYIADLLAEQNGAITPIEPDPSPKPSDTGSGGGGGCNAGLGGLLLLMFVPVVFCKKNK